MFVVKAEAAKAEALQQTPTASLSDKKLNNSDNDT